MGTSTRQYAYDLDLTPRLNGSEVVFEELCLKAPRLVALNVTSTISDSMSHGQTLNVTTTSSNFRDVKSF